MRRGGECCPAASSSSPHASALGGGCIPPPLSCLGIGFWYKFVPSSNGRSAFYLPPPSPPKSIKNAAIPPDRSKKFPEKFLERRRYLSYILCYNRDKGEHPCLKPELIN